MQKNAGSDKRYSNGVLAHFQTISDAYEHYINVQTAEEKKGITPKKNLNQNPDYIFWINNFRKEQK